MTHEMLKARIEKIMVRNRSAVVILTPRLISGPDSNSKATLSSNHSQKLAGEKWKNMAC